MRELASAAALTLLSTSCAGASSQSLSASQSVAETSTSPGPPAFTVELPWGTPNFVDSSFGNGTELLRLSTRWPNPAQLPASWYSIDLPGGGNLNDDPSCASVEPIAATETHWETLPPDPEAVSINQIRLIVEQHESAERATLATQWLGSDPWLRCEELVLNAGPDDDGFEYTSPNPRGEVVASPIERAAVNSRRQEILFSVSDDSLQLIRENHAWAEGSTVFRISTVTNQGNNTDLTLDLSQALTENTSAEPIVGSETIDRAVSQLRAAIEPGNDSLSYFEMTRRAQFRQHTSADQQICALHSDEAVLALFDGPRWETVTRQSVIFQGGRVFASAAAAQAELDQFLPTAEPCLVTTTGYRLGPIPVTGTSSEIRVIDGVDILVIDVELIQPETDVSPIALDLLSQRTITRVDNILISFSFIGIAGDEPDLAQLTADAANRMEDQ